jgi:hypothetical protein
MAHFAELNNNNIVLQVIVVNNSDILDENGNESEQVGKDFCHNLLGREWIQTSYNATFRKNYAGIGYTYSEEYDGFIPPKPEEYSSWIVNPETCCWEPPIPYPSEEPPSGRPRWKWNESVLNWE